MLYDDKKGTLFLQIHNICSSIDNLTLTYIYVGNFKTIKSNKMIDFKFKLFKSILRVPSGLNI